VRVLTAAAVIAALSAGVFAVSLVVPTAGKAATALFSPAQVKRGEAAYAKWCAACHEKELEGGEHAPPLVHDLFWGNWEGKPSRAYYSRIISTMPADTPGVVPPSEVLEIVAFIFSKNGIPIGTTDVKSSNELNAVPIAQP